MAERQSAAPTQIARVFAEDAALSDFIVPFPDLFEGGPTIAGSFERMAQALDGANMTAAIQFSIRDERSLRHWCLILSPEGCRVAEARVERPHLEILTDVDSWSQVAKGDLAPLEAFGLGKLRVRGDIRLARLVVKRLEKARRVQAEDALEEQSDA